MLPRLRDEETLRQIDAAAAGSGAMSDESRRAFVRDLQSSTAAAAPARRPATAAELADMGIGVD